MKSFRSKFAALIFMMFLTLPRFVTSTTLRCRENQCRTFDYKAGENCIAECERQSTYENRISGTKSCTKSMCDLMCDNCFELGTKYRLLV